MEPFIRAGFKVENIPNYNCGVVNRSLEEWQAQRTKEPFLGVTMLSYGLIVEACYTLVMVALWRRMKVNSCYKIMLLLGLFDMLAISVNSIITGVLFLLGANYCTHPTVIYLAGSCGLGLWCGACLICLILVINRLCDLWKANLAETFFGGWKMHLWLSIPILYTLYFTFFTVPVLFDSALTAWFFSPMILRTEAEMQMFYNIPHTINNLTVVVVTCLLYVLLCVVLGYKYSLDAIHKVNRAQKMIMIQSVLICFATLVASLIYVYMQFFTTPIWLILLGHVGWQLSHGIPAFVYLILNATIRHDVMGYLGLKRFIKVPQTHTILYSSHHI